MKTLIHLMRIANNSSDAPTREAKFKFIERALYLIEFGKLQGIENPYGHF